MSVGRQALRHLLCKRFPQKGRYPDRGVALKYARRASERPGAERELFAFKCKKCKGWHLSHEQRRGSYAP